MNVTSKGRYALRVMLDLARHKDEGYISLKTIAERTDCSMKYLEMIVSHLKKAKLVESTRGKEGGYKLCRELSEYSVGEILRCIEDNLAPVSCINKDGNIVCDNVEGCVTIGMWKELDDITNNYLDAVSLEDLITGTKWNKKKLINIKDVKGQ